MGTERKQKACESSPFEPVCGQLQSARVHSRMTEELGASLIHAVRGISNNVHPDARYRGYVLIARASAEQIAREKPRK